MPCPKCNASDGVKPPEMPPDFTEDDGAPLIGFAIAGGNAYLELMPLKAIELPPNVAKTFVMHMHAFHAEPNAIKRDKIAGDAAHLLKPYLPPRNRKLRLSDIYEMFEAMKDQAVIK